MFSRRQSGRVLVWQASLACLFCTVLLARGATAFCIPHPSSSQHLARAVHNPGTKRQSLDQTDSFQFDSALRTVGIFPPLTVVSKLVLPPVPAIAFRTDGCNYNRPPPAS
jgi:hypothetical protein